MKAVIQQSLKKLSYTFIRAIGYFRPNLSADVVHTALPQVPPYTLPMPVNAAQLPEPYRQQFGEELSWPERQVYLLHNVHVSWHGIVFKNLRLFQPSVSPLVTLEAEFSGSFLLRQWWGEHQTVKSSEIIGLAHGPWSVGNYYHWMVDTLPRLLLLKQYYPDCRLLVPENLPAYARETAAIFGFNRFLPFKQGSIGAIQNLAVSGYAATSGYQDAPMIRAVRKKVLQSFGIQSPSGGRRIYVSRSRQHMRRLLNEADIRPLLQQYKFETVFFEDMTFEEQVRVMHEASVLVGVHGANLTNMLFMGAKTTVVELMYMNKVEKVFNPCYYHLAFALELAYYNVPCRNSGPEAAVDTNDGDLEIDPADLQKIFSALFAKN